MTTCTKYVSLEGTLEEIAKVPRSEVSAVAGKGPIGVTVDERGQEWKGRDDRSLSDDRRGTVRILWNDGAHFQIMRPDHVLKLWSARTYCAGEPQEQSDEVL